MIIEVERRQAFNSDGWLQNTIDPEEALCNFNYDGWLVNTIDPDEEADQQEEY